MKITFVLPVVNMSGGIRVVSIYAQLLHTMGHVVTLVSPPPQEVPLRRKIRRLLQGGGWQHYERYPKSHIDDRRLNHRVLDKYRPPTNEDVPDADVIVATWWETAEWISALGDQKGVKVYFIQHHEIFNYNPIDRVEATYRLPFHQIVIARWLKEVLLYSYGKVSAEIVHNGVDHTQFFAPKRGRQARPTIGFLYHKAHFKGVDTTLAAISRMKQSKPDIRVICFGSQEPSAPLPLEAWIEFYREPEQDRIKDIYAACDVWITASRSEGFNLTAMEAMACRTPIVSTRTGWPEEAIVQYENGVLVDVDDVDAIVEATLWMFGLKETEWQQLSEAAYRTVEPCTWERSAKLFEKALLGAIQSNLKGAFE